MTHMTRILTTLVIVALTLAAPAQARRSATLAPPGNSAVSQYLETVPTDKGNGVAAPLGRQGGGGQGSGGQGGALEPSQRRALNRVGADGRTLAAVVDATSPTASEASTAASGGRTPRGNRTSALSPANSLSPKALASGGAQSPASLMLSGAIGHGGGGVGVLLPALMLVAVLGVLARLAFRRREHKS